MAESIYVPVAVYSPEMCSSCPMRSLALTENFASSENAFSQELRCRYLTLCEKLLPHVERVILQAARKEDCD